MQKCHALLKHTVASNETVCICRNIENLHTWLLRQQSLRENSHIHPGHDDIGQQQVDFAFMRLLHVHGFLSVLGNAHAEPVSSKICFCEDLVLLTVIDKD